MYSDGREFDPLIWLMIRKLRSIYHLLFAKHYVLYTMGERTEEGYRDIRTNDKNFITEIADEMEHIIDKPMWG